MTSSPEIAIADGSAQPVSWEKLFHHTSQAVTLPSVIREVIRLSNQPNAKLVDLCDAIQSDPALVAQILRRVNSAYYTLNDEVKDFRAAANLLGFREIVNVALTVYLSRVVNESESYGVANRAALWNHSVSVAATSHLISRVCGRTIPGLAFSAGLMHDLGLILLDTHLRRYLDKVVRQLQRDKPIIDIERRVYGFDHAQLGSFVAAQWELPEAIVDSVRYHHEVEHYHGIHREVVYVVALANYFCSRLGRTSLGVHNVMPPPDRVYAGLGLDELALSIIWDELDDTLDRAEALAAS